MRNAEDNDRLERYRQGDVNALSELVEQYRRPLFGFILRMTEGREDADEIFQEVWIRAIRNIRSYRNNHFLSWLFRITHNLIIDRVRRKKQEVMFDDTGEDGLELSASRFTQSPSEEAHNKDMQQRITKEVNALPVEQREVFLMRMEGGLPFKEIAAIQKTSINTSLARMTYAIEKLRKNLAEEYALLSRG